MSKLPHPPFSRLIYIVLWTKSRLLKDIFRPKISTVLMGLFFFPPKVKQFIEGSIAISPIISKLKKKQELIKLAERFQVATDGTVGEIRARLEKVHTNTYCKVFCQQYQM
jgi:hypothetical protein